MRRLKRPILCSVSLLILLLISFRQASYHAWLTATPMSDAQRAHHTSLYNLWAMSAFVWLVGGLGSLLWLYAAWTTRSEEP